MKVEKLIADEWTEEEWDEEDEPRPRILAPTDWTTRHEIKVILLWTNRLLFPHLLELSWLNLSLV